MITPDLTDREIEILKLLAEGLSNKEIAGQLFIADKTVRWYNSQIYSKLGVKNRQEAVGQATTLGLLAEEKPTVRVKNNLPAQTTPFIGREQELNELAHLFANENNRLITILAPGGMGKTRLALEVAGQYVTTRQTDYSDGIFYVPLQPLSDPQHIISQIASSIGFQFMGGSRDPEDQLLDYLSQKKLLLLMDNWEHLLDGASLVADILRAAPGVRILATSREKLNLSGETICSLKGMDFPTWETPEDALEYDAVQLLVQSARRIKPNWKITAGNLDYVARVCRLTEGMPLGIVLAASWLDALSLQDIADEIQHSVDFLVTEMRDMPERQHSIRAVFDYTWNRLSENEQQVFMKLSVFRGGFTRQAAQTVAGTNARILQALVNKALVTRDNDGRYDIHELLRQYAEEQIVRSGDAESVRDAHSHYFLSWLAGLEADVKGHRQAEAASEIDKDFVNVRAAWEWAVDHEYYDWINSALECLTWFSNNLTRLQDGLELIWKAEKATRDKVETQFLWARLITNKILVLTWAYPSEASKQQKLGKRALEIARLHDKQSEIAYAHLALGLIARLNADYGIAVEHYGRCLSYFREVHDVFHIAWALHWMAHCIRFLEGLDVSIRHFRDSLELRQESGDQFGTYATTSALGYDLLLAGNTIEAEAILQEQKGLNDHVDLFLGLIHFMRGNYRPAKQRANMGLHKAAENRFMVTKSIALSLLCLVSCIEENYAEGVKLGNEARSAMNFGLLLFLSDWALSLAYCGLEDYKAAYASTHAALAFAYQVKGEGAMTWCLPPMAILLAQEGQSERAIEILALAYHHPASATGWLDQWSLLTRLQASLKEEVGEKKYHAFWEHGKELDLYEVVSDWLSENG